MENSIFINDAISYAIKCFLESRNNINGVTYNSFFTVVVRLLSVIYDELDIINPYKLNNPELFKKNLNKYGYSEEKINEFLNNVENFYESNNKEDFVKIQKSIIDMFAKKKICMDIKKEEFELFRSLLYSPYSVSPLMVSYNFIMSKDPFEILNYFKVTMELNKKATHVKEKQTLNIEAYEVLKYTFEDINKMSAEELDKVNKEVYAYFDVNENAINKNYLLDKAVYEYKNPKVALSTGNGYVDILFVLSIISTLIAVTVIIALCVF